MTTDQQRSAVFIPIPTRNRELLEKGKPNFSLAFPRLMRWQVGAKIEKPNDAIEKLRDTGTRSLQGIQKDLACVHERQSAALAFAAASGLRTITIHARTTSPFISGLGAGHPNETGMILDRNTGCPYLPASSIKGVLRMAYAVNLAEKDKELVKDGNVPDELLREYFGDVDAEALHIKNYPIQRKDRIRGQIIFFDAFPESPPGLHLDIMNPHYPKYYGGENRDGPVETESPVPIKFIAVETGCVFVFRCFLPPRSGGRTFDGNDEQTVRAMFATAFTTIGFGGKTAIGYGRFKDVTPQDVKKEAEKPKVSLEADRRYQVKLTGKDKKGKWRCTPVDYPELKGIIAGELPGKVAGNVVDVVFDKEEVFDRTQPPRYVFKVEAAQ